MAVKVDKFKKGINWNYYKLEEKEEGTEGRPEEGKREEGRPETRKTNDRRRMTGKA
ncbi:MAG: hypothetical protein ACNS64_06195 [Candidatus Halalkalibacterium sp. M3_1C_030]